VCTSVIPRALSKDQSDHPVLNSRYLLYEAQVAHYFGLEEGRALSSVTAFPADVMGLGWRIGYVKEGI
jgi:imidazolonepropionase-like amidohydrolase